MTIDFIDYFWGDKNSGFDVLYHNMKYGLSATRELSEFLREKSNIEEYNSKQINKLTAKLSSGCVNGTIAPIWVILKSSTERLSSLHMQMVQKLSELVKDVTKYAEDVHKKQKVVKDEEAGTLEAVHTMQSSSSAVQKSRDIYLHRLADVERLKKDNNSSKDLEKAEIKLRKLWDDYKAVYEKHIPIKSDFEQKMNVTCKKFQEIEENHIKQMKEFLSTYIELLQINHDMVGQVHLDFKRQYLDMSIDKLLEQFVLSKYTGIEKPDVIDPNGLSCSASDINRLSGIENDPQKIHDLSTIKITSPDMPSRVNDATAGTSTMNELENNVNSPISAILRSGRNKTKTKKFKKKTDMIESQSELEEHTTRDEAAPNTSEELPSISPNHSTVFSNSSSLHDPQSRQYVDEEGFSLQPRDSNWTIMSSKKDNDASESGSDSDAEEQERKIHIEIKPITNVSAPISASVDELRATVESLSLTPLGGVLSNHREYQNHNSNQSPNVSNTSTPTLSHPYAPLQSPTFSITNSNRYIDDLISENAELPSTNQVVGAASSIKPTRYLITPTPTCGNIAIPRPPSRRSESSNRGRISPALSRAESVASLEFRTSSIGIGSSRGPSPLTIGMSDTIPLAVAFHEVIHAYFRGSDESRCQVKMSGDMMISFPAGIINHLTSNPNPTVLKFRIKNIRNLEFIMPNKQLVVIDTALSDDNNTVMKFNMVTLSTLLRRQYEQNSTAAYFNVDILKYRIRIKDGANSCPLQLVSYWKCEQNHTDIKIDYKYNNHAMASPSPLLNVCISVPVNGSVQNVQSKPHSVWMGELNRLVWNFTDISQYSEHIGIGTLRARLDVASGPSTPSLLSVQFNCEGTTLSGIEFELVDVGYRLSLTKRRFISGKYICGSDGIENMENTTQPTK